MQWFKANNQFKMITEYIILACSVHVNRCSYDIAFHGIIMNADYMLEGDKAAIKL